MEAYIGVGDGDVRVYHGFPPNGQNVTFQIRITKIEDPATHKVNTLELIKLLRQAKSETTYLHLVTIKTTSTFCI